MIRNAIVRVQHRLVNKVVNVWQLNNDYLAFKSIAVEKPVFNLGVLSGYPLYPRTLCGGCRSYPERTSSSTMVVTSPLSNIKSECLNFKYLRWGACTRSLPAKARPLLRCGADAH